jgi:hypothetical protein
MKISIPSGFIEPGKRFERDPTAARVADGINRIYNTLLRKHASFECDGIEWLKMVAAWGSERYDAPPEVSIAIALYDKGDMGYAIDRKGRRIAPGDSALVIDNLEDEAVEMVEMWLSRSGMSEVCMENFHNDIEMALAIDKQACSISRAYVRSKGILK